MKKILLALLLAVSLPAFAADLASARFTTPDGRPAQLSAWRGKVVVVNFWASWCAPCREEMPMLESLRQRYRARGLEVVGVALEQPVDAQNFASSVGISYPVLIGDADTATLMRSLGNASGGLPYTVVLDRQGKVVARLLGRLSEATLLGAVEPRL